MIATPALPKTDDRSAAVSTLPSSIALRPATAEDNAFLFDLYCTTRADELAAWGWDAAQQAAFLRFQFMAQTQHYGAQLPHAEHSIICNASTPIGRIITIRGSDELRLVDLALLPSWRNTGIGSGLISDLIDQAAQRHVPLRLQVRTDNRARRLYERLGFRIVAHHDVYLHMEHHS